MTRARLVDWVTRARRQLSRAIKAFWQRRAARNEVERLDPKEATRIAHDLGISGNELRVLAAKDASSAELLTRRMATLSLDSARIDPAVMRDLQRCCSQCVDKGLCIHELEDKPRDPLWPDYCPNEQTLAALAEEQGRKP